MCVSVCPPQVAHAASDEVLVTGGYDTAVKVWDCRSWSQEPIQTIRQCKVSCRDGCAHCVAGWLAHLWDHMYNPETEESCD